jgi:hypothetical protein
MSNADLEAEAVRRISASLQELNFWTIDIAPHTRTDMYGMAHLLHITYEGMRYRVKCGIPSLPRKVGKRNTFYIRDFVMLDDMQNAA